jgi:anhydro-N-acetylmuramic acid kinase
MKRLAALARRRTKLVLGLLSGTSADGVDCGLVRIRGHGLATKAELLEFLTVPYSDRVRASVLALTGGKVPDLCRMNFVLGERFAEAAAALLRKARVKPERLDLVGSHGQTVHHVPRRAGDVASTLQIGEAAVIAERLGVPVVSDFRTRDIAAGGEGAPLSAYVDYLLFRREGRPRALLNLGGIGNVTVVTPEAEEVFAFDTGPANMPLDEVIRIVTRGRERFDRDGRLAATGRVDGNLLRRLLGHPYLQQPIPKTTGREAFGREFVLPLLRSKGNRTAADVLATLTAFSAHCVRRGFDDFVFPRAKVGEMFVSGGGVHNLTLLSHLRRLLPRVSIRPIEDAGYPADAKEAILFAILANDTIHGVPNNLPGATGARWPCVLGKITP